MRPPLKSPLTCDEFHLGIFEQNRSFRSWLFASKRRRRSHIQLPSWCYWLLELEGS
jgi:hypothetical protein